jgi:hypothetical protein
MQHDFQSIGAAAVTHLANKVMMALFQPSQPFFRNDLSKEQREDIRQDAENSLTDAQIDEALAEGERAAMKIFNLTNNRVTLTDAMMLLIITGNVLIHADLDEGMKMWTLRDYIVKRDLVGNMTKLIFRETKAVDALEDGMAMLAKNMGYDKVDQEVTLYTCVQRVGKNKFVVWQELEDVCYCQREIGIYNKQTLPWIPLVWNRARAHDYGTGLVENYAGTFHSLSTLSEAELDYVVLITDVKNLVDPTGMTDVRQINEAPSGAYVHGREEDLFVHAPNVSDQANFLDQKYMKLVKVIGAAFLMNSMVTRDAERVTAEEYRGQVNELEGALGGTYSRLANELQLPLARMLSAKVDPLFKDITPLVTTGLESLSRTSDLDRIRLLFQDLIAVADIPEKVEERIDYEGLISLLGAGHQVDYNKFLLSDDKVQANRKQAAQDLADASGMEAGAVAEAEGP